MTDLRKAAQQALEAWDDPMKDLKDLCVAMDAIRKALEQQAEPVVVERWLWIFEDRHGDRFTHKNLFYTADEAAESARFCGVKAIKKIDSSKVMQQAEPVAWMDREGDLYKMPEIKNWAPPHVLLYTAPPQRQWDKPSASFNEWWDSYRHDPANPFAEGSAAYWAWAGWKSAQRQWVGLTDEEIFHAGPRIGTSDSNVNPYQILINARAIEAKLKERNHD